MIGTGLNLVRPRTKLQPWAARHQVMESPRRALNLMRRSARGEHSIEAEKQEKKVTPRSQDFAGWYNDVILRAELADYSPVRGCIVFRPDGFAIWEALRDELDRRIKRTGARNAYFPLFIPQSFIHKEAQALSSSRRTGGGHAMAGGKEIEEPAMVSPPQIDHHQSYVRAVDSIRIATCR